MPAITPGPTVKPSPPNRPYPELCTALRSWAADSDQHVFAAVELLAGHDVWLARADFQAAAVGVDRRGDTVIRWQDARQAFQAGAFLASAPELAVLDFAIGIGSDRYGLARMSRANTRLIAQALSRAMRISP